MKNNKTIQNDVKDDKNTIKSADCATTSKNDAVKSSCKKSIKYPPKIKIRHLEKDSFLAMLIKSFLSYSLIIAIAIGALFIASTYLADEANKVIHSASSIGNYKQTLIDGKYGNIPTVAVLGEGGWFDIVTVDKSDGTTTILHTSIVDKDISYTANEITCIEAHDDTGTISIATFEMKGGEKNYLVTKSSLDEDGNKKDEYVLLDSKYEIISGTVAGNINRLTEKEFEYLTHNADGNKGNLHKMLFYSIDNLDYYVIYLDARIESNTSLYILIVILAIGIVAVLALMLRRYVHYINKHVQNPLVTLSIAMTEFASGGFKKKIEYEGSKEFEQLCDSFNEMVGLLNATDEQKRLLEDDKRRMLAGLSHDLKTPITIIQGFAEALRDGLIAEDEKQKYLQLIVTKSKHMEDLINEFYEYTKLDHPDFSVEKNDVDIAELARSFLAGIYDEFDLRGYNLETNITDEVLTCEIDEKQIARVFNNLASNFFKYTPIGSTLYFGLEKVKRSVRIIIADNGNGIGDDARADIFKPFVVGEQSRSKQGTGLGLAVCEKIILAHGGKIELLDRAMDGYNTQFEITLELKY